jgi:DNA-binding transcriptional LysR family regulator
MGAGYAWFPEETVRTALAAGRLGRLPRAEGAERHATLYLVVADAELAGPGTVRLAALLRERTSRAASSTKLERRTVRGLPHADA